MRSAPADVTEGTFQVGIDVAMTGQPTGTSGQNFSISAKVMGKGAGNSKKLGAFFDELLMEMRFDISGSSNPSGQPGDSFKMFISETQYLGFADFAAETKAVVEGSGFTEQGMRQEYWVNQQKVDKTTYLEQKKLMVLPADLVSAPDNSWEAPVPMFCKSLIYPSMQKVDLAKHVKAKGFPPETSYIAGSCGRKNTETFVMPKGDSLTVDFQFTEDLVNIELSLKNADPLADGAPVSLVHEVVEGYFEKITSVGNHAVYVSCQPMPSCQ